MSFDDERSLELSSQARNMPGKQPMGRPLPDMLARVVAEFSQLPPTKDATDYPDLFAYLSNGQDTIVRVRNRRPIIPAWGRPVLGIHEGYFVDVYDLSPDGPVMGLTSTDSLSLPFSRIEVTDEEEDPIGDFGLTPTSFPRTYREVLGERFAAAPKSLPADIDQEVGLLEGLFNQKEVAQSSRQQSQIEDLSIRARIIEKFFLLGETQGLSAEVGNAHFILGSQKGSPIADISKKIFGAYRTIVLPDDPSFRTFGGELLEEVRDPRGLKPMLVTIDESDGFNRVLTSKMLRYARSNPLFACVDISTRNYSPTSVGMSDLGWYQARGGDVAVLARLYIKIGVDKLLTDQVRELASSLG